jgi:hypothetical protein
MGFDLEKLVWALAARWDEGGIACLADEVEGRGLHDAFLELEERLSRRFNESDNPPSELGRALDVCQRVRYLLWPVPGEDDDGPGVGCRCCSGRGCGGCPSCIDGYCTCYE